jgi:hypothetical protein
MASSSTLKGMVKDRTREAAEVIAATAIARSSKFSKRIPLSVKVVSSSWGAYIIAGGDAAPNAYPFETGARHPLFGNRNYWYPQPKKPFLEQAADAASSKAANVMSNVIDDWMRALEL